MSAVLTCTCAPCPGRGNDGHGLTHCAECCFGSGIQEFDPDCFRWDHREQAARQHAPTPAPTEAGDGAGT